MFINLFNGSGSFSFKPSNKAEWMISNGIVHCSFVTSPYVWVCTMQLLIIHGAAEFKNPPTHQLIYIFCKLIISDPLTCIRNFNVIWRFSRNFRCNNLNIEHRTVCNLLMLVNSGHLLLSIGIRSSGFRCRVSGVRRTNVRTDTWTLTPDTWIAWAKSPTILIYTPSNVQRPTSNVQGAPARHREPYSMLFVLLLARSGEAGGSLCLYYKW